METDCPLCGGTGGWEDHVAQQSVICYLCNPEAFAGATWPNDSFLEGRVGWLPGRWPGMSNRYTGPLFQAMPWLLVIHSGSIAPGVAEYLHRFGPAEAESRGTKVSCHVNWSSELDGFAQGVRLDTVAWHCGGSRLEYEGRTHRRLNFCSIGIELPGPWNKERSDEQLGMVREAAIALVAHVPSLRVVVRHSDIDSEKLDPGPGFRWECLEGLGLEMPFR